MRGRRTIGKILKLARRMTGRERPIVLMYHRVVKLDTDPWALAVSPTNFAAQIALLSRHRRVVPMHWLAGELSDGRLPRRVAAITFDDAYADVLANAVPVLKRHGCPASVYAVSEAGASRNGFWWDILARMIFEPAALPHRLSLTIGGKVSQWDVGQDRRPLFVGIHAALKSIPPEDRNAIIQEIARWAGHDGAPRHDDLPMTPEELRRLARAPGIEVGAHTRTHPSLPLLDAETIRDEINGSRKEIEDVLGKPVTGFAYPYGDHDGVTVTGVAEAGMAYAVTAEERAIGQGNSVFKIPRIVVGNWDAAEFRRRVLSHA